MRKVLITDCLDMTLILKLVAIIPVSDIYFLEKIKSEDYYIMWKNKQLLKSAEDFFKLNFQVEKGIIKTQGKYPELNGNVFQRVYILTPIFENGYRPDIYCGKNIDVTRINSWGVVEIIY